MTVCNSENVELLRRRSVDHGVWEAPEHKMPKFSLDEGSELWIREQQLNDTQHFGTELITEPWYLTLVTCRCRQEFLLGLRMKLVLHCPRRDLKCSNTKAPGTPLTLPSTRSR